MSFRKKAIEIFYKAATSSRKIRNFLTPLGLFIFFTLLALFILVSLQVDKFLGLPIFLPTSLNVFVSVPILALGLFLWLWSALHFIKAKGTPVPFNPPPKLVVSGPYSYSRNPMLGGVFITLFGLGVLLNSISLLFILLNLLELKAIEEPELEKRLGREYLEYKRKTPMLIPGLKVKSSS